MLRALHSVFRASVQLQQRGVSLGSVRSMLRYARAKRIPVHVLIDRILRNLHPVAGMTVTLAIVYESGHHRHI